MRFLKPPSAIAPALTSKDLLTNAVTATVRETSPTAITAKPTGICHAANSMLFSEGKIRLAMQLIKLFRKWNAIAYLMSPDVSTTTAKTTPIPN